MLHNLIYRHLIASLHLGEVIVCANRWTNRRKKATWFPPVASGLETRDLTHIDLDEFALFTDVRAVALWVDWENNHG